MALEWGRVQRPSERPAVSSAVNAEELPPPAAAPMAAYLAALAAGRFLIQRCTGCARHVFYPRRLCPHCACERLEWVRASGEGTVHSTTTVARAAERGGPYNVSLIDLAEGVRMMSRVDGVAPESVAIGQPVRAQIVQGDDGPLVVFRLRG